MKTFDSAYEARIAPILMALGFIRVSEYYKQGGSPRRFYDSDNAHFCAMSDWWHPKLRLYVETKQAELNEHPTKQAAATAEAARRASCRGRRKKFGTYDMLQTQWSHSRFKQAAVQRDLSPQSMIVVFDKPVPYATMIAYAKIGLVAIHLDALEQYTRYIHFCRRGLPVQWNLPYPEENAAFVL
ncbi:hypothetical protein [Cupriavidus necator]|uniref:Uncharacterized protein n=1 Tax=Cupriavidus pinatubonensis (strain JMP 134 / LMG 1197) TaxID=264198 RepID=Q46W11_CUPPJ|nr:hypothetical protein [Cupriavidus necator]